MKRCTIAVVIPFCCFALASMAADEVLSGQKLQQLQVAPDQWVNRSVVLEGIYEGIAQKFSTIERQNRYTPDIYVKFTLGQCPYPCIGMRSSIENGLEQCSKGDLVRVTGDLVRIEQDRTLERVEGQYDGGRSWNERVKLVGPLPSEYIFSVGHVQKGWGGKESPDQMSEEGRHLEESHYQKVGLEQVQENLDAYREKAVQFKAVFYGSDDDFSEKEKQVGLTPDNYIQFKVEGSEIPLLVRKTPTIVEGLKEISRGTPMEIFGRIRTKTGPAGMWSGFFVDHAIATVRKNTAPGGSEETPPLSQDRETEPAPRAEDVAPMAPPPAGAR